MHFCKSCSNMYYIKLLDSDNNKLSYYCRNCGTMMKIYYQIIYVLETKF